MRIDAAILRKRQEEIKETVDASSAVLVWPLDEGLLVVAANKSSLGNDRRIYAVHDRTALVMRGEYSSAKLLANRVITAAYSQIHYYSAEDVDPSVLLGVLGARLAESYEMPVGPRVQAEGVLVRLEATAADDFVGLAECSGDTQRIEGPLWRGTDEKGDRTEAIQKHLRNVWKPDLTPQDVLRLLTADGVLDEALKPRERLEAVFLDRSLMLRKEWTRVFRPL